MCNSLVSVAKRFVKKESMDLMLPLWLQVLAITYLVVALLSMFFILFDILKVIHKLWRS